MSIGNRIKERRQMLDMSVDRLADILGKNRATVYRYENDEIENMSTSVLEPLAAALNTTPAELMGWSIEKKENSDIIDNKLNEMHSPLIKYFVENEFSDDECNDIIKYAEFVRSKRKE